VPSTLKKTVRTLRRNAQVRAVARNVPGLSWAYHETRKRLIMRRGISGIDYDRVSVRIHTNSRETVNMRLHPFEKEPWTVEWMEKSLRDGDVLYDIGANVGVYTLIAAGLSDGRAQIVAIEPGYANYAALCDNIVLNGASDSVFPIPIVLGASRRIGSLSYRDTSAGAALHVLDADHEGAYRQPVLVHTLDELVELFNLPVPTLVKLDVDGSEAAVLAGAARLLKDPRLRSLVVEVDVTQTDDVQGLLADAGFELSERYDDRDGRPLPDIWYGVFVRSVSPASV
jgi:FkbM family methyltransferase